MTILDWLLGDNRVGWLKTALVAGFLGMAIYAIAGGSFEERQNKYYFFLLGLPVFWGIKTAYWRQRSRYYWMLAAAQDSPTARAKMETLTENNFALWKAIQDATWSRIAAANESSSEE